MTTISGNTALVTGASRGFGLGIATALVKAGGHVVGLARDPAALAEVRSALGDGFTGVTGDATDAALAGHLLDTYRPTTLVLNAGAVPLGRPIQLHTWETFGRAWETDVKQVFSWVREALLGPLAPGSTVISFSSGAALFGSPMSGGYAGAKATVRFISQYAAAESDAGELGIRFVSVLPKLTPNTAAGAAGARAYARRAGLDLDSYIRQLGPTLTAEDVGAMIAELAADDDRTARAYLAGPDGLTSLD
jgi:NAD(P)-dependent dehydrogenase (short-subunit alcohol dehydrogenase family)